MYSVMRLWIRENFPRYNNDREKIIGDCMTRFNHTRGRVKDLIAQMRRAGELPPSAFPCVLKRIAKDAKAAKVKTSFRASVDANEVVKDFDDEGKIHEGIKTLGTRLIKDSDFRMELGISCEQWKIVSHQHKFSDNKQELKGRRFRGLYWGEAAVIKDLRKKLEL